MKESRLRVEIEELVSLTNPFFGKVVSKRVIEETIVTEKRIGVLTTPKAGLFARWNSPDGHSKMKIYIDAEYFPAPANDWYTVTFFDKETAYEVCVRYSGGYPCNVQLNRWDCAGDCIDGNEADSTEVLTEFRPYKH